MDNSVLGGGELSGQSPCGGTPRAKPQLFSLDQRQILLRYFDECGMTSTHRRNAEIIQRCANEVGTTIERIKNWIGSEAVKRKKKAGILPRPKIELLGTASSPHTRLIASPPVKKIKRVNGYNLFFSDTVRSGPEISTDFRERNATVARRWAELTEDERKEWAAKAEAVCASSMQDQTNDTSNGEERGVRERGGGGGIGVAGGGGGGGEVIQSLLSTATSGLGTGGGIVNPELAGGTEEALIEKTLLSIQEKFDLLEQMGFEGYAVLVNTTELQSHFLATTKGRTFHKLRQTQCKPLENPFIGHVFTEEPEASGSGLMSTLSHPNLTGGGGGGGGQQKRLSNTLSGLSSVETMQKSVLNAFAVKYKVATGRLDIPYDNLTSLGVQVYGMPPGVPFHNPLLYNQQQLQQILANLEKIVFLKLPHESSSQLSEVEISADSVAASLVGSHTHHLHLSTEEDPAQ